MTLGANRMLPTRRLTLTLLAWSAVCCAQTQPSTAVPSQKTAEQVYKNIQVLKGSPADQLIPAMQFITASLGVQCEFCHVESAFEKDDKEPKQTARKMMRMMLAIDQDSFDGHKQVTCYSCHRGMQKPVAIPVISEESSSLVLDEKANHSQANASSLTSADQIIEKYLHAISSTGAAPGSSTRIQKGMLIVGTTKFPVEVLAKGPAERVTTVRFPGSDSVTGFNAQAGWLSTPGRGVHEMNPAELDGARMEAYPQFAVDPRQIFKTFTVQPPEKIEGRPADVVSGMRNNYPPVQLYFDQESGLLVRLLRYVDTPLGLNPAQIDYGDYREEDGIKIPFRWTIARPGGRFTIQIDQMQLNVPIDDAKFNPPADSRPAH
jgi:photosynthetic reaction center cytochrome c subunit